MGLYLAYDAAHGPIPGKRRPRLLIAIRPDDVALGKLILGEEFDAVICHTYEDACAKLDESISVVTCGVHFDNGKVFDLLRHVRENPCTESVPIFMLLGAGSRYTPAIVDGIRAAAKLLKVTAFTDLARLSDKLGKDESIAALRQGIREAISAREQKPPSARPSSSR